MDHAQKLSVRPCERVSELQARANLGDDVQRVREGQNLVVQASEKFVQISARDVLHGDEVGPVLLAELVDMDDVRVGEPRRKARLIEEHVDKIDVIREAGKDPLDDHETFETRESRLVREKDLRHSADGDTAQ